MAVLYVHVQVLNKIYVTISLRNSPKCSSGGGGGASGVDFFLYRTYRTYNIILILSNNCVQAFDDRGSHGRTTVYFAISKKKKKKKKKNCEKPYNKNL